MSSLNQSFPGPRGNALVGMAAASALHFAAFECARPAILAMFSSQRMGFGEDDAAMPFATGCISPFSIVLLWFYSRILQEHGPRVALLRSALLSIGILTIGGFYLTYAESKIRQGNLFSPYFLFSTRLCTFFLFISQNSLVHLIFTQHWAFLGSLGQQKGSKDTVSAWIAPVAGIGSVFSTLAASSVKKLTDASLSLPDLLFLAAFILAGSAGAAEFAYTTAEKNGFAPKEEKVKNNKLVSSSPQNSKGEKMNSASLWNKSRALFRRVPVLGVLCVDVVICQCLSAVVTFLFFRQVRQNIINDQERAGWTGNCYAWINGLSGVFQFFVIPMIVTRWNMLGLWAIMPAIMGFLTFCMAWTTQQQQEDTRFQTLSIVAGAFSTMKILEYSFHGVCNELLFASLDYESRHVGKQEIALLANRFSKSLTAVTLSLLTKYMTSRRLDCILSWTACLFTIPWFFSSLQLSKLVPPKDKTH